MSFKFGERSLRNLGSCVIDLQKLFTEVIKHYDCSVIEGHRTLEKQDEAFHSGKSHLEWPHSKHNRYKSRAVDVVPYPIDWNDWDRFYHFAGFVKATAIRMGLEIRCGIDWDGDNDFKDQNFHDAPHFELKEPDSSEESVTR